VDICRDKGVGILGGGRITARSGDFTDGDHTASPPGNMRFAREARAHSEADNADLEIHESSFMSNRRVRVGWHEHPVRGSCQAEPCPSRVSAAVMPMAA